MAGADGSRRFRAPLWSRFEWWVKAYSYVTIVAALYGIAYAHIPPIMGSPWSLCTGPNEVWCKLSIHLFEVPMAVFNLFVAWYGLWRFSRDTIMRYMSLLDFAVAFNMVFFLFETNLLMEGLSRLFPFWEIFAFASIAIMLLAGTVFTIWLKMFLVKSKEPIIPH